MLPFPYWRLRQLVPPNAGTTTLLDSTSQKTITLNDVFSKPLTPVWQTYRNMKSYSDYAITITVARRIIAHETTGRNVGWWALPASRPVDCLVFDRRIVTWQPIIVRHHFEAARDGIQVQHGVICIPVAVVINPHVACYSCQAVRRNFLMVDDDFPIFISYWQTST